MTPGFSANPSRACSFKALYDLDHAVVLASPHEDVGILGPKAKALITRPMSSAVLRKLSSQTFSSLLSLEMSHLYMDVNCRCRFASQTLW
jgi:hypothetical protein